MFAQFLNWIKSFFVGPKAQGNSSQTQPTEPEAPPVKWKGGSRPLIVDISHWDGTVNFDILNDNVDAVILKATDGDKDIDPKFKDNLAECLRVKLPVAAYHFLRPQLDAKAQSDLFKSVIPPWCTGICDFEVTEGQTSSEAKLCAQKFMELAKCEIMYASPGFLNDVNGWALIPASKLWLAEYGVAKPRVETLMWQYTETAAIPGIEGKCDLSLFYGTAAEFNAIFKIIPS